MESDSEIESIPESKVTSLQRERYHAIQTFDLTIWIIFIYIWFLDNSTWALFVRILLQTAFCNQSNTTAPSSISLASSLFGVTLINFLLLISHLNTDGRELLRSKAIFIDFLGKESPPSRFHLIAVDLLLCIIQYLQILLIDGTTRADLEKDDWRGDIDGVDFENRKPLHEERDLESGVMDDREESDLIFDSQEFGSEEVGDGDRRRRGGDLLADEEAAESSPFLDSSNQSSSNSTSTPDRYPNLGNSSLSRRRRAGQNAPERSPYSEPIAILSFSRTLSIFKSIMKNQIPEEDRRRMEIDGGDSTAQNPTEEGPRLNPEVRNAEEVEIGLQRENRRRIERELREWSRAVRDSESE